MSISPSTVRRRSFKLHKAILGAALALSAFGVSDSSRQVLAQAVNLGAGNANLTANDTLAPGGDMSTSATSNAAGTSTITVVPAAGAGTPLTISGDLIMAGNNLGINIGGAETLTITGDITGTATLTLDQNGAGAGTINISGAKATTGPIAITASGAGTLTVTVNNATGLGTAAGGVSVAADTTLDIQNASIGAEALALSGTLEASTGASEYSGVVTLGGAATLSADAGASLTLDGAGNGLVIGGNALTKAGAGTVVINTVATGTGSVTVDAGTLALAGANTYSGTTTVNSATLQLRAGGSIRTGNVVVINNGGTFDLNGQSQAAITVNTTAGATLKGGVLGGTINAQGATIENVTGNADLNLNSGSQTIKGVNAFGDLAFNAGTTTVALPTNGSVPVTATGTISANGGQLNVDATGLTAAQVKGEKTIIAGTVPDAIASATTFTYAGNSEKFEAFNKPLATPALYDVALLKGSLVLSVKNKAANDICGVTGLCADGSANGKLEGLDKSEVRSLYGKVVLPAIESGKLDLPFWTTKPQMSKYLISGLMPRNVDAAGTVLSSYNYRMADTLFERLPLRQFDPVEVVEEEIVIEEVETKEPVRGLWKTTAEGELIEVNGTTYEEDPSLTAQYADRDNMRAWVRGFGGDVAAAQTTRYVYKSYNATNAGGVVGVDYAAFDDFQIGVYANYGDLAINTDSNKLAGSGSWNPTGWGGGITADYWTDSYYVQGLFGASAFAGDQDRSIVAIGGDLGGGNTLSGNKNVTSYVGALRAGAPMQLGSFYFEPQAQATWSGNQEDSFSEGGNTNFKLKYKSRETNFLQTELGIKVAYPIALGQTQQLVPSIRVAWLGDWNMDNEGQKIGYRFSNKTIDLESSQQDQNGALLEGGLDYTVANIGATSFKVYGRGGAEVWDTERGTNWRASGGVTVQF